jgi:hypothetical protein
VSDDELRTDELLATLPVTFARRRTVDAGAFGATPTPANNRAVLRSTFRPSLSGIGAYRRWSDHAESAGFPVGGMAMLLGLTDDELVVYTPTFVRSRPKRRAGAIRLTDIAQMTAMRSLLSGRVVLLFADGGIVELETMRVGRARRFVAAVMARR